MVLLGAMLDWLVQKVLWGIWIAWIFFPSCPWCLRCIAVGTSRCKMPVRLSERNTTFLCCFCGPYAFILDGLSDCILWHGHRCLVWYCLQGRSGEVGLVLKLHVKVHEHIEQELQLRSTLRTYLLTKYLLLYSGARWLSVYMHLLEGQYSVATWADLWVIFWGGVPFQPCTCHLILKIGAQHGFLMQNLLLASSAPTPLNLPLHGSSISQWPNWAFSSPFMWLHYHIKKWTLTWHFAFT